MLEFKSEYFSKKDIEKLEKKYNAKYLLDSEIKQRYGWSNDSWAIFYCQEKHPDSNSHYLAVLPGDTAGTITLANGQSVADVEINGILFTDTNEFLYSRYRHDFRSITPKGIAVDGGREYTRIVGSLCVNELYASVKIVDDEVVLINPNL